MLRQLVSAFASLAVVSTLTAVAVAQEKPVVLKVGDDAPKFEAVDDTGESWKSEEHVGKKILVIYFYPKDMTPGCTKQACSYRDAQEQLVEDGVEVVGVSADSVESHQAFKKAEDLNFTLLADPEGKLMQAFGVKPIAPGTMIASRWTFLVDLDGKIAHKDEKVDPVKDVANIRKVVAAIKANAK
jgi:peroxiredoxin Q/BCP